MSCELCKREHKTKWYYENEEDIFDIFECETCHLPMVVLKRHDMTITIYEMVFMVMLVKRLFGSDAKLRLEQRKIKDHWHAHIIQGEKPKEIGYHMRVGGMAEA